MLKQILLVIIFIILIDNIEAKTNDKILRYNFTANDLDRDEIYGYLFLYVNERNSTLEEITNFTSIIINNTRISQFFINKYLGDGYYQWGYQVSDDYRTLPIVNSTTLIHDYVEPKPRARIFQDFYILNNGSIELEQQILFKNMGSEEFYAYPLYDLFDSYKSCSDEKYYRLDLTPITVNKSQTPRFVRRIMVLPANGENGFLIKCKANFNIERLEDNKNAFSYKTSSWNKTGDGIEVEKFEKRIYLPKHKFLDLMDVDFFTSPPKTPSENEDNYIFIYQEEFIHDKDTYVIRIVYEYKYNLKRIIVWLVLTLLTIWIGKISFKKIKYYVVHKIFKKENKPPPDKSSGSLRNTIPENM